MRFIKPITYVSLTAIAVMLIIFAIRFYVEFSLQNMQLDLSGLVTVANTAVAMATLTIPPCQSAPDYSPIGDQKRERTMLYVATIVDLYKTTFRTLPDSIDDLDKLPSFDNAEKLNSHRIKQSCSIHGYPTGSYVLTCGASLPPANEIDAFLRKAGNVQRFYMVGGTEILYVPAGAGYS
jgi:hypothetical protein